MAGTTMIQGDCIEHMRQMPDGSIDSIVCDPPYGLGFMGKQWDQSVPGVEWAQQCLRVLKPGGHLVAFGGTRTVHRLAVAIEDAGFEIRDQIGWVYYSGFPKSLDVSKAIDKRRYDLPQVYQVTRWIRVARDAAGLSNTQIDRVFGFNGMSGHWTSAASQPSVPTLEQIPTLLDLFGMSLDEVPDEIRDLIWTLNGRKGQPGAAWFDREVIAHSESGHGTHHAGVPNAYGFKDHYNITAPATPDAVKWSGWGTALKPATEPAVLARKPLSGTVASTVLEHGTGAINIDGCRCSLFGGNGDWPANLIQFPKPSRAERERGLADFEAKVRMPNLDLEKEWAGSHNAYLCGGATARKNNHPTVKPVALMRWLVRLVTPPGGITLDPFMGSGTAGVAAVLEGFRYIGVELSAEYHQIAVARIEHAQTYPEQWNGGDSSRQEQIEAGQIPLFMEAR